jgi:rubredoxin
MSTPAAPTPAPSAWECRECLWLLNPSQREVLRLQDARCPGCGRALGAFRPIHPTPFR